MAHEITPFRVVRGHTVQVPRPVTTGLASLGSLTSSFLMTFSATSEQVPSWWSRTRDNWLDHFWRQTGNDLLAGAVSTLTSKIVSANFYVEGPKELAKLYMDMILYQSDFGRGWNTLINKWVTGYLSRDGGGLVERLRSTARDRTGPALGFAHLDESKCRFTDNAEWPIVYEREGIEYVKLHRSNIMRIVDMPSGRDVDFGYGFCSVSRAISTAHILMDLVKYKRERLSDLPPAGFLTINNTTEAQWQDVQKKYDTRQRNQDNTVFKDVLTILGLDPEYPVKMEFLEMAQLWDKFDDRAVTEMAVYTFALAFGVDPREYWPVSSGSLGSSTEANVQHMKAKSKGEGAIFSAIERQMNDPLSLPGEVKFGFDQRDVEEELTAAEVNNKKIENTRKMWESSPNRSVPGAPGTGNDGKNPESDSDSDSDGQNPDEGKDRGRGKSGNGGRGGTMEPVQAGPANEGIITTEEARILLARDGIIPPEFVLSEEEMQERIYAARSARVHKGPMVRMYRDGSIRPVFDGWR